MHAPFRKTIAVASLLVSLPLLSSCQVNQESLNKSSNPQGQTTCADSTNATFSSAGAAQPILRLTDLPPGVYTHVSAEIYIESRVAGASTTKSDVTRYHFLETQNATTGAFSVSTRCAETAGNFRPYFTSPTLITSFTVYDPATNPDRFDTSTTAYAVNYQTNFKPSVFPQTTSARSSNSGTILNSIAAVWNSDSKFARRSGNLYEFYGVGVESGTGRTIYGKASYTRTDLP